MNEIRYYLGIIKKAMQPVTEEEQSKIDDGKASEREQFKPTYIVTAVKLPTGAIELATNTSNIEAKIDYILEAYDDDMKLKTNPDIQMMNLMVI